MPDNAGIGGGDLRMIGVALTVAFFAFFWALRGKLNMMGVENSNGTAPLRCSSYALLLWA
jgi:hypothetical protein